MPATLESLLALDAKLQRAEQHGLTPFWREQAARLYGHPTANALMAEVGRGGIKSGFGSRIALNEVLCGDFVVPAGEVHFWVDVSENKAEALQRLNQYEAWLTVLRVPFERSGDSIVLPELRRGFLVRAAQVGRLSGFRAIGFRVDEAAKLPWGDSNKDPAPELWASSTAMTVTHTSRRPKRLALSSPMGSFGWFNGMVERGDTADQIVASRIPTWVANPSISEVETRRLEPVEHVWLREYCAIPQDSVEAGYFPPAAIDQSIDRGRLAPERRLDGIRYYIATDAAFAVDRFGVAVVTTQLGDWDGLTHTRGPRVTRVQETHAWRPDRAPSAMALRLHDEVCRRYDERRVYLDQFSSAAFSELCSQVGLSPIVIPWTAGDGPDSKAERYRSVRTAMLEGSLRITDDPELIRDLRSVRSVLTPAGNERIELPRTAGGHADRVSAMVMAASEALRASPDLAPARETTFERQRREYAEQAFAAAASGQGFPGSPGWI